MSAGSNFSACVVRVMLKHLTGASVDDPRLAFSNQLHCWGAGESGQLGLGDERARTSPEWAEFHRIKPCRKLRPLRDARATPSSTWWKARADSTDWRSADGGYLLEWSGAYGSLACGGAHLLALSTTGHIFGCGRADSGELGHENRVSQRIPCLLPESAFKESTPPLSAGGASKSDGASKRAQLLLKSARARKSARAPPVELEVRLIACGRRCSAALLWSGDVYVWGRLGKLSFARPSPCKTLSGVAKVSSIACGQEHLVILTGSPAEHERAYAAYAQAIKTTREHCRVLEAANRERLAKSAQMVIQESSDQLAAEREEAKRAKLQSRLAQERGRIFRKFAPKRKITAAGHVTTGVRAGIASLFAESETVQDDVMHVFTRGARNLDRGNH